MCELLRRLIAPVAILALVAFSTVVLAPTTAHAQDSNRIFDLPYEMRDLDNGLRVIVVPTGYPDIVSIQMPVQTGSRNEVEPGKSGFAHFFEHMMFRGTETYPAEQYNKLLQNAGADQNAYTTDDFTNYHVTFTKADLETILELEADRFVNLKYTEEQFRTEAQAVKGEYLKNYSNPIQKLIERSRALSFKEHTYRHTTMGFFEDIEDMPNQIEYSYKFFDRWYRPEKAVMIIAGDVEPAATFALVEKYFSNWERGNYDVQIPTEPPPQGRVYEHIQWEAPTQPWLLFSFRGPAFVPTAADMPALDVISELYFSESSDLYQKLVVQEQTVDQLFAYFPNRKDPNQLVVAARLSDGQAGVAVREAILDTLAVAQTRQVDAARLSATKSRLKYAFTSGMDNTASIASILARFVQHERTPETINELYRSYDALTPPVLREITAQYFTDTSQVLVTLSNDEVMPDMGEMLPLSARVASIAKSSEPQRQHRLRQMHSAASPLVDVSFLFEGGAAYDPPGKKGLAAVTANMLTEAGSASHTYADIQRAMFPMAAGFTAQVDKEMTRLSGSVHKDNLAEWYTLISAQLLDPGWRESDFERVKTQAINGIRSNLVGNNDEELGKEVLYQFIYGQAHAYGNFNGGASDQIANLTLADVQQFYRQHYTRDRLTVGLAGGYPENFPAQIDASLASLPGTLAESGAPDPFAQGNTARFDGAAPAPAIKAHEALIVEKETPAVAVSFGFPIDVRRGHKDWLALWLVRSWLGEHRNSSAHLFGRIREARGMNYGDYAYIEYFPAGMFRTQPGANLARKQQIFQVWLRPLRTNNDAHFATRTAMYELRKLRANGIDKSAFESVRNFLDKYASLLVATQSRQLGYQLDSDYYATEPFVQYVREGLKQLTRADVNRAIRRHLKLDEVKFVFVTREAQDLRDRLVQNQPSPLEYNSPKPELASEDAQIEVLKLDFSPASVNIISAEDVFR